MKNIIIFGGSGMTGEESCKYALSKGFKVRILVRDNKTIPESIKDQIDIVNGDVTKYEDVEKALKDQDAVVVVLGTRNDVSPTTMMSEGMKNIATGMTKLGLKKVSVCMSAFNLMELERVPKTMMNMYDDHARMFDVLESSDHLEWRALYPPHITSNGMQGELQVVHDKLPGRVVTKEDLGRFLVDCLDQEEHLHKRIGMVTVPKE